MYAVGYKLMMLSMFSTWFLHIYKHGDRFKPNTNKSLLKFCLTYTIHIFSQIECIFENITYFLREHHFFFKLVFFYETNMFFMKPFFYKNRPKSHYNTKKRIFSNETGKSVSRFHETEINSSFFLNKKKVNFSNNFL